MRLLIALLVLLPCMPASAQTNTQSAPVAHAAPKDSAQSFPSFLPAYYKSVLDIKNEHFSLVEQTEKDGLNRYVYATDDQIVNLAVEHLPCDSAKCEVVFKNVAQFLNKQATDNGGSFRHVTAAEFRVEWKTGLANNSSFVFRLPTGILFWSYQTRLDRELALNARFSAINEQVDHQRYDDALLLGNVELGRWEIQARNFAHVLLKEHRKNDAIDVLKNLLATSPFDYEAQLDFAENSTDGIAAKSSAQAVYDNAEDSELIARARRFLKTSNSSENTVPVLNKNERGLQLILIPLPPCNMQFVHEAAAIYEKITNVQVKIARLNENWTWGVPDRIPNQKQIQQAIIQEKGPTTDFTGWDLNRYKSEILKTVESKDALTKFSTQKFMDDISSRPSQYDIGPYLNKFIEILSAYRSNDIRTMYVGVTEMNIYSGDSNYVFSLSTEKDGAAASIFSYSMMTAKTLGESYESRKRLTERMAKEFVPASLKSLRIPRPADPTDPYSYSNGVDRLAQKTLILSEPTKAALDKFRNAQ